MFAEELIIPFSIMIGLLAPNMLYAYCITFYSICISYYNIFETNSKSKRTVELCLHFFHYNIFETNSKSKHRFYEGDG